MSTSDMSTSMEELDRWSRWLLESRFGGDHEYAKEYLDTLREVRDRVLNHGLKLGNGAILLDWVPVTVSSASVRWTGWVRPDA
jgi:hypothetical protein